MRVKRGTVKKKRHKKYLKAAKGYSHAKSHRYRTAKNQVEKGMQYSTRDRIAKKREFRKMWIGRITAACKIHGISYSKFIFGLKRADIRLDRRIIHIIAQQDSQAFTHLVAITQKLGK